MRGLFVVVVGALVGAVAPAHALSLLPVSSSSGLVFSSEVEILDVVTGLPAGATILDGAADPTGVSVVFRISQTATVPPEFGPVPFGIILEAVLRNSLFVTLSTVGWLPGVEPDALVDAVSGDVDQFDPFPIASGDVTFDPLVPETTDTWFVTLDALVPGDELVLAIRMAGSHTFEVVPEPGTITLIGTGVCAIAAFSRRRGRPRARTLRTFA